MSWKTLPFEKCIQKVKTPFKLQKKAYQESGNFPVVSQEASLISGYHDNSNHLFKVEEPVIIFGDHTQVLKYVDFSFVMGADGVKILKPINEINAKYFYYILSILMPKGKGYARHYKLLKKLNISFPPLAEQQRIVAKLDAAFAEIDRAMEIATSKLENNRKLVESTLTSIFNNLSKGTETTLGEYYDVRDGTHDSPKYVSEGYPLVTSKNLKRGSLDLFNVKCISEEDYIAINKRSAVHTGDVLMAMIGTIGNPIVITEQPRYSIKNVALFKTNKNQNPWFLKYYLEHPATKAQMQKDAKGTTQKFVGLGYLRNFPINAPTLETQNDIVEQINTVFQEIETLEQAVKESIEAYGALKSAILAQELQPPQSELA
jgi:restriction endonuclease S subunit